MVVKLGFLLGYTASMAPQLVGVLDEVKKKISLRYTIVTPYKYTENSLRELRDSDIILVYSPRLPQDLKEVLSEVRVRAKIIAVDEEHAKYSNVDASTVMKASKLLKTGGRENLRSLVLLMLREAGLRNLVVPDPVPMPWHGVYHPLYGVFDDIKSYLDAYPHASRPLVGVLFYRSDWLYGRTQLVDVLIDKLEKHGLGVVPVFTYGFQDKSLGAPGAHDSISKYFFLNGEPVIDVLVNITSFHLVDPAYNNLLDRLSVPVIQAVITHKSPDEWLRDEKGLDYMSIVYRVVMPEINGVVEPIVVAGTSIGEAGEKKLIPIMKHVEYLARRVYRWVVLRRKKPSERRIAIILINPPCKSLEANVAVGLGLDVPESVVRFLKKLRELGYDTGSQELPGSGEELIKLIMSKKAISEFRWTSVEDIVTSGGVLDFVDANRYIEWFRELPEELQRDMIRVWGDPLDVLEKKLEGLAGMVYKRRFVIPGLRFGNIVVLPQPKRGCAGPRCDGSVCKILHDPSIPPPHQWLAVYRWITRIFRADLIIHFGTHGYLEFLPGKETGLSWMCWPEVSLDDVPHLYVYSLSNPMEGVVAKRRSYAVIVDHLYPVMSTARSLEDLDALLTQYMHAKNMGDKERAQIIIKQLLETASSHGISLPRDAGEDEIVNSIHRYVELVKNTQINLGLHILGSPPSDPRLLAEYTATICSIDTPNSISIKRAVATYLGIDYDDLIRRPMSINKVFNKRNSEVESLLHKIVVNVLERLIKLGVSREEDIIMILEEEVSKCLRN